MITFQNTFSKGFGHINLIAITDEVDTFNWLVLTIGVSLIEIGTDVGTQLILELHIMFHLHNMRR